jgi:hypothetical protein
LIVTPATGEAAIPPLLMYCMFETIDDGPVATATLRNRRTWCGLRVNGRVPVHPHRDFDKDCRRQALAYQRRKYIAFVSDTDVLRAVSR